MSQNMNVIVFLAINLLVALSSSQHTYSGSTMYTTYTSDHDSPIYESYSNGGYSHSSGHTQSKGGYSQPNQGYTHSSEGYSLPNEGYSYSSGYTQSNRGYTPGSRSYRTVTYQYDSLCVKWNDNECVQCAKRSVLQDGRCKQVSDLCNKYDLSTGLCISCYDGFKLTSAGQCVGFQVQVTIHNPYCAVWRNKVCVQCAPKTFFNEDGICKQVSPQCKTYSNKNGSCLSCFGGYTLKNGKCIVSEVQEQVDIYKTNALCSQWRNGVCVACSPRSYKDANGICQKVSDSCRRYSQDNGNCLSCYDGYTLEDGKCLESAQIHYTDPLCVKWGQTRCLKCAFRSYFNEQGRCTPVDSQCKTFSYQQSICKECYQGYSLINNKCIVPGPQTIDPSLNNPYCAKFSSSEPSKCLKCAYGSYMQKGLCILADHNCKRYSQVNGLCLDCYPGYALVNAQCIRETSVQKSATTYRVPPTFVKPETVEEIKLIGCVKQSAGECLSCESQYTLFRGNCLRILLPSKGDRYTVYKNRQLCLQWANGRCLRCVGGTKNINGVCQCQGI